MGAMFEPPTGTPVSESVIEVRSHELDSFGHVNHAVFLNYLEHGRFNALKDAGFPYEQLVARGWGVYVVRLEIDYVREARLGERLRVRTWAHAFRRSSMVLAQEIHLSDEDVLLTRALVTAVFVGEDRRPIRVPQLVRTALGAASTEEGGRA